MGKRFRYDAREWLRKSDLNFIADHAGDPEHGPALVEDLYRADAVNVEVGIIEGEPEDHNEADALYVTLPKDRDKAIKVMCLLAWQHGDEVDLVDGEEDVVRIWWD